MMEDFFLGLTTENGGTYIRVDQIGMFGVAPKELASREFPTHVYDTNGMLVAAVSETPAEIAEQMKIMRAAIR